METEARKLIHLGINFLTFPKPVISQQHIIAFQQAIIDCGLEFSNVDHNEERIIIRRSTPSPLEITIVSQKQPMGQILIISKQPKAPLSLFIQEAQAAIKAFNMVWPSSTRKILGGDAAIRELHPTDSPHAFQELWEKRLGQQAKSLSVFERAVRGGGLRFVLEPEPGKDDSPQIEIKIESYLLDTSKIYVEALSNWRYTKDEDSFKVDSIMTDLNSFIVSKVFKFLGGNDV